MDGSPATLSKILRRPQPPRQLHRYCGGSPNPSLHDPPRDGCYSYLEGAQNFLLIHHADARLLVSRQLAVLARLALSIGSLSQFHLTPPKQI